MFTPFLELPLTKVNGHSFRLRKKISRIRKENLNSIVKEKESWLICKIVCDHSGYPEELCIEKS